ncbi:hypothetical protein [Bifidobacterium crudilactis]|uniref:hypothetical protein n=1 Tax=Bifidobacterium crudilactis TaxID=327277 RepID=UPI0023524170|nr:hypothetical protein [Bifidobacterium crudilactis]MCI2157703.1 hypothetical protein [Bifidobacterium crudilactis]
MNTAAVSSSALTVGDETAAVLCRDREVTVIRETMFISRTAASLPSYWGLP